MRIAFDTADPEYGKIIMEYLRRDIKDITFHANVEKDFPSPYFIKEDDKWGLCGAFDSVKMRREIPEEYSLYTYYTNYQEFLAKIKDAL